MVMGYVTCRTCRRLLAPWYTVALEEKSLSSFKPQGPFLVVTYAHPGHLHPRAKGQEARRVRGPPECQDTPRMSSSASISPWLQFLLGSPCFQPLSGKHAFLWESGNQAVGAEYKTNVAKFPLDTDCHAACQELEVSAEVSLLWLLGFLAVRGGLREHHIEAGRRGR